MRSGGSHLNRRDTGPAPDVARAERWKCFAAEQITVFEGYPPCTPRCLRPRPATSQTSARYGLHVGGRDDAYGDAPSVRDKIRLRGARGIRAVGNLRAGVLSIVFRSAAQGRFSIGTPIDGVQMRVVDEHAAEVPTGAPARYKSAGPT